MHFYGFFLSILPPWSAALPTDAGTIQPNSLSMVMVTGKQLPWPDAAQLAGPGVSIAAGDGTQDTHPWYK